MAAHRIMTFNGGGIRGVLSLGILKRLVEYSVGPDLIESVTLFGGTSVGANIAAGLANVPDRSTALNMYSFFPEVARGLYRKPNKTDHRKPKYQISELVGVQNAVYGTRTLRDLARPVVITSFDIGSVNQPWKPLLFSTVGDDPSGDTYIADAVVASSAMPGMYGSHNNLIDGAFYNHDPSIAAIASLVSVGARLEDMVLIDIGTGFMQNWIEADASDWGAEQWQTDKLQNTPALLLDGTRAPILNASLNGTSTTTTADLAKRLLPGRCLSINPPIDFVPEDDVDKIGYLQDVAANCDLSEAFDFVEYVWYSGGLSAEAVPIAT